MLWKKESNRQNASYVNIFKTFGYENQFHEEYLEFHGSNPQSNVNKNDALAIEMREAGYQEFRNGDWDTAKYWYSRSLCHSQEGRENINLAYANRSSCHFNLKKYKESLIDIELAIAAGYPQHLMSKLEKRKKICLKHIEEETTTDESDIKLSFAPNERYPYLANVLEFGRDEDGNPRFMATEDIAVGRFVAVEKAFSVCLYTGYGQICDVCLQCAKSMVPCKNCTQAMLCLNEAQCFKPNIIVDFLCI